MSPAKKQILKGQASARGLTIQEYLDQLAFGPAHAAASPSTQQELPLTG